MSKTILRPRQLCELLGVSPMTVWRWRKNHGFPEPIALGKNSKGFLADEISAWIEVRRAERDARQQRAAADRTLVPTNQPSQE